MESPPTEILLYKRARFQTRLPVDRIYTRSHYWLARQDAGVWRVGFTRFATRMLGESVEHGFEAKPGDAVTTGQAIGWVEGFKAVTDVYCVASGSFGGGNPDLDQDLTLLDKDPYHKGWMYLVRGEPEPNSTDVHGYVEMLNATIDKMQGT